MKAYSPVLRASYLFLGCLLLALASSLAQPTEGGTHGIDIAAMDRSVKPGDDFFQYCNGTWIKHTQIPPDRPGVGVFSTLQDLSLKRTSALIEEAAKSSAPAGSGKHKIADLYHSYIDEAGIEAKALQPLQPHLEAVTAIHDKKELAHALGESLRADVDPLNNTNFHTSNLFGLWVAPDFNAPEHYTAYLLQGGIELPDREYYLNPSEHMRQLREQYQRHVATMLKLAGLSDPDTRAAKIIELEKAIAEKHWTLDADQDVHKANNPWKQSDFQSKAPSLD